MTDTQPLPSEPGTVWLDRFDEIWRVAADGELIFVVADGMWLPADRGPFRQLVIKEQNKASEPADPATLVWEAHEWRHHHLYVRKAATFQEAFSLVKVGYEDGYSYPGKITGPDGFLLDEDELIEQINSSDA